MQNFAIVEGLDLPKVTVLVRLKQSLDDAQGRVIERALKNLGYSEVRKVRIGKLIEVWIDDSASQDEAKKQVEAMCQQLLANPVIEEFEVRLDF
ncbi:MAG: phosphoribosylformylglycinamidine synthase subunit PurS [Armatimonadetes bacterium]|nr:phosphoribosylformylglycinamidine synthase subunit PurS [Armatimonadota bacterium]MDW8027732.1 phosphoribosylformylglycinamidine synthase subunit PurS [Armatimonadota bacterium]